jgi:hypothetical protein
MQQNTLALLSVAVAGVAALLALLLIPSSQGCVYTRSSYYLLYTHIYSLKLLVYEALSY